MRKRHVSGKDIAFDIVIILIAVIVFFITIFPFWNILVKSFNSPADNLRSGIILWPRDFTAASYEMVLKDSQFLQSFKVSVLRVLTGVPLSLLFTSMAAFVLTREKLLARKIISMCFIFTMYFSGGIIPQYIIYRTLALTNTFWVYILPACMDVWNMLLIMTYIRSLPKELEDASSIDGANEAVMFFRVILPLSLPIMATVGLFVAVGHWNSWFDSHIFVHDASLKTMQAYLVRILQQNDTRELMNNVGASGQRLLINSDTLRMATTIIATVPIICVYPFVQRYFVKGILVGAVKA